MANPKSNTGFSKNAQPLLRTNSKAVFTLRSTRSIFRNGYSI
jgi:hypothetical protein